RHISIATNVPLLPTPAEQCTTVTNRFLLLFVIHFMAQREAADGFEFDPEKYVDDCLEKGPAGMHFLFRKVSPLIFEPIKGYPSFLVDCCLYRCLEESERSSQFAQSVILCSATIKRIMTIAQDFSFHLSADCQRRVLDYVFRTWDVIMEVVCYETVDIFEMLLSIHSLKCAKCKARIGCEWTNGIATQLFHGVSSCRSRYKCLLYMLKSYSTYANLIDTALIEDVYSHIGNATLSVAISDIISFDLSENRSRWDLHIQQIISCLSTNAYEVRTAIKDRLLPKLIRTKLLKDEFLPLVLERMKNVPLHVHCLDSLLSITRFLVISNKKCDSYKYWNDFISLKTMESAVLHCSVQVRLAAWLLLTEHPQRTKVLTEVDLSLVRAFILTNMTEQLPAIRQKILAGLRKILTRLAETSEQVLKGKDADEGRVKRYNEFISFLVSLSFDSLSCEANFDRRIMALSIIRCLFLEESLKVHGKVLFLKQLNLPAALNSKRYTALVACLDDSFQLCQIMALDILKNMEPKNFDFDTFKNETMEMMRSVRSHNTLAAGYRTQFYTYHHPESLRFLLSEFVSICEEDVKTARENLIEITKKALHPWLNTIMLLLESVTFEQMKPGDLEWWTKFAQMRLIPLCFVVADVVMPAVHSMSPEGYIPDEALVEMTSICPLDSKVQIAAEMSQVLLVCCWRAHKYVSTILAWTVVKLCPFSILSPEVVHRIGDYYWLQLTECKHCGAFETAVDGFSSLCAYLWKSNDPALPKPSMWLEEILAALQGGKDLHNLCSTRRSAGVPHLITAILATEPPNNSDHWMNVAMRSLLEMKDKELIYRIHSMNVLKAMFSSATLGERVIPALEWACRVAISGCSSSSWPERNAAAQLTAALRSRIFGVTHTSQRDLQVDQKNRQSSYEFFSRFPSLYLYLYKQLQDCRDEFSLYPILIFLTHLFPSHADEIAPTKTNAAYGNMCNYPLAPFIPALIRVLLWCRAEKLRKLSAAALVAIARPKDISFVLDWVEKTDLKNVIHNHIHSVLLLLSYMLEMDVRHEIRDRIKIYLEAVIDNGFWLKWCDYNKNILLVLCNDLGLDFATSLNVSGMTLTRRPLAYAMVSGNLNDTQMLSDFELRLEVYRQLQLRGDAGERFEAVQALAVEDLQHCPSEREARCILDVLYLYREIMTDKVRKKAVSVISHSLASEWRMLDTISLARRLLSYLCDEENFPEQLAWMKSCLNVEEEMSKRVALQVGGCLLRKGKNDDLIAVLAAFLQDEDQSIREKASSLLSKNVLNSEMALNPDVCYRLIAEKSPTAKEILQESEQVAQNCTPNGQTLYDPCASNTFAEGCFFGDFAEVRKMVEDLLDTQD
ncbi:unnamed protein product, partial [Cylicocyclus nassatus]